MKNVSKFKRMFSVGCSAVLLAGLLSACSSDSASDTKEKGESGSKSGSELTVMMPSFYTTNPTNDSPVVEKIGELTDTDISLRWVPNDSYTDKFNITLASGNLPEIMVVTDKHSGSFVKAAQADQFWEVGPYLDDYSNLKKLNQVIRQNASINGKLYGVPRTRVLGRMGITYRKDWLENLGMEKPKTIKDFYNMLKAFKNQDPDQDGKDDTYGMVVTKYPGPWDIIQTWFGVPNQWGKDENGKLIPYFMDPDYVDALNFFNKLYEEGLVNQDFAAKPPSKWQEPIINGKAGVIVDVADQSQRIEEKIDKKVFGENVSIKKAISKQFVGVMGPVKGPYGRRSLPTSGYSGLLVIPKASVQSEDELKNVLAFLNKMNNKKLQILASNGIEGRSYDIKDGVYTPKSGPTLKAEYQGLNQMLMFIPESKILEPYQTPIRKQVEKVQKANKDIVVPNVAAGLISETYSKKGAQLDKIMLDARIRYISGQIDESGLKEAIELWKQTGGAQVIKEMNELYKKANQ